MTDRDMTNSDDGAGRDKGGGADRSRSGPGFVKITTFAIFFNFWRHLHPLNAKFSVPKFAKRKRK